MTTFIYTRRLHSPAEETIRIIELHPSADPLSPLTCSLRHIELQDAAYIPYDAISYCWGGEAPVHPLHVDSSDGDSAQILHITPNLADALQRFRDEAQPVTLWADAVCINQADNEEKSHQVPLMWKIYSHAQHVKVWLGRDLEDYASDAVLMLVALQNSAHAVSEMYGVPLAELTRLDNVGWRSQMPTPDRIKHMGVRTNDPRWANVVGMIRNQWFSRIWIVQEVAMARDVSIHWGRCVMPWATVEEGLCAWLLSGLMEAMASEGPEEERIVQAHDIDYLVSLLRTVREVRTRPPQPYHLFTLLLRHRLAQATNPRDKVYALLNLARDPADSQGGLVVTPNYDQDVGEVFYAVTERLLYMLPSFSVLSLRYRPIDASRPPLPSWVPDWSAEAASHAESRIRGYEEYYHEMGYTLPAAWDAGCTRIFPKHFTINGPVLELRGILLDEIVESTSCTPTGDTLVKQRAISTAGRQPSIEWRQVELVQDIYARYQVAKRTPTRFAKNYVGIPAFLDILIVSTPAGTFPDGANRSALEDFLSNLIRLAKVAHVAQKATPSFAAESRQSVVKGTLSAVLGGWHAVSPGSFRRDAGQEVQWLFKTLQSIASDNFFRTKTGYVGTTTDPKVKKGDVVALVQGSRVPLILRKAKESPGGWTLMGDCYLHGAMSGELFKIESCQSIRLV